MQVVVRPDSLSIQDGTLGLIKRIERKGEDTNWKAFTDVLIEIKSRFPREQGIALLLDKAVTYKTMIEVMDKVRSADVVRMAAVETVELFPNVSIGDAPEEAAPAGAAQEAQP